VPTSEEAPAIVTEEILAKVLKGLPQGSAAGLSGWTYEHSKAATTSNEHTGVIVLQLVNSIVQGTLTHIPHLLDARLLLVAKPLGGVRPIAIGEVWAGPE
jgi:hypothetical protein